MVKFVGMVMLLWLCTATALWTAPVPMTHTGGTVPQQKTFKHGCGFDEPGVKNCTDTSDPQDVIRARSRRTQ